MARRKKQKLWANPQYQQVLADKEASTLLEQVRRFIAAYYEVRLDLITPNTILEETLGGKSEAEAIDEWELQHYLGEEFGVPIPIDKVMETTVRELADYIQACRRGRTPG